MNADTEVSIAATVPVAEALIEACANRDGAAVATILKDVAFPDVLAIMLANEINPLLLDDANFDQVKFDHPALSFHAGRYENGDRDMLAVRCYVHRQSIRPELLRTGPRPMSRTS